MTYDDYLRVLKAQPIRKELAFPREEYERRVTAVQKELARAGLDGLVVSSIANACYLSGYQAFAADLPVYVVLGQSGSPTLISTSLEVPNSLLCGWLDDVRGTSWMDPNAAAATVAGVLDEKGLARGLIGLETRRPGLNVVVHERLKHSLAGARFADGSDAVTRVRRIKSPAELDHMRRAAGLARRGVEVACAVIRPGITENEVAAAAFEVMTRAGGEYYSTQPIVTAGYRTAWAHASFKRGPIEVGDPVFLELGGVYQRYHCGLMHTAVVGPPSAEIRRLADASNAAIDTLLAAAKPGRAARDVAREVQRSLGALADEVLTTGMFGYSIGVGFPPTWREMIDFISADSEMTLEAGMTFHSPIPLRVPNRFGVGFSETWLVTETGTEVLTPHDRSLHVAPI
jgi:Xaa-Pro aminopeptidase